MVGGATFCFAGLWGLLFVTPPHGNEAEAIRIEILLFLCGVFLASGAAIAFRDDGMGRVVANLAGVPMAIHASVTKNWVMLVLFAPLGLIGILGVSVYLYWLVLVRRRETAKAACDKNR